jgi:hypothetical protein
MGDSSLGSRALKREEFVGFTLRLSLFYIILDTKSSSFSSISDGAELLQSSTASFRNKILMKIMLNPISLCCCSCSDLGLTDPPVMCPGVRQLGRLHLSRLTPLASYDPLVPLGFSMKGACHGSAEKGSKNKKH